MDVELGWVRLFVGCVQKYRSFRVNFDGYLRVILYCWNYFFMVFVFSANLVKSELLLLTSIGIWIGWRVRLWDRFSCFTYLWTWFSYNLFNVITKVKKSGFWISESSRSWIIYCLVIFQFDNRNYALVKWKDHKSIYFHDAELNTVQNMICWIKNSCSKGSGTKGKI